MLQLLSLLHIILASRNFAVEIVVSMYIYCILLGKDYITRRAFHLRIMDLLKVQNVIFVIFVG